MPRLGALHTSAPEHAKTMGPGQQFPIAGRGRAETAAALQYALNADDRGDVHVLMGIDTVDRPGDLGG
jgi:hypothetical protein